MFFEKKIENLLTQWLAKRVTNVARLVESVELIMNEKILDDQPEIDTAEHREIPMFHHSM